MVYPQKSSITDFVNHSKTGSDFVRVTVLVAVTFSIVCCSRGIKKADSIDISQAPVQVVGDMFVVQTDKGKMQMRMESPRMERYQNDSLEWELFSEGFAAYAYTEDGLLETEIKADEARHTKPKSGKSPETWTAYGNVTVKNLIKQETMETDTLYWDRDNERIYTDCYVQIVSPSGFMQGYGMESDQRARNSVLYREFNSYGLISRDSTEIVIDTVNFIGPFPKK